MKLYYSKGACSLAVRIAINEMGLKAQYEAVNLATKQTEKDVNFLTINSKGSVPTLVLDNGDILTENAVIQQYLADHNKATSLLPAVGELKRYHVLEWLNFISTDLHKNCSPLFNSKLADAVKTGIFRPQLKSKLKIADDHLKQNRYLMGDQFTLPDGYLFVILSWLPHLGIEISSFPNLSRYSAEVSKRKAVQQSLQEEGLA